MGDHKLVLDMIELLQGMLVGSAFADATTHLKDMGSEAAGGVLLKKEEEERDSWCFITIYGINC